MPQSYENTHKTLLAAASVQMIYTNLIQRAMMRTKPLRRVFVCLWNASGANPPRFATRMGYALYKPALINLYTVCFVMAWVLILFEFNQLMTMTRSAAQYLRLHRLRRRHRQQSRPHSPMDWTLIRLMNRAMTGHFATILYEAGVACSWYDFICQCYPTLYNSYKNFSKRDARTACELDVRKSTNIRVSGTAII